MQQEYLTENETTDSDSEKNVQKVKNRLKQRKYREKRKIDLDNIFFDTKDANVIKKTNIEKLKEESFNTVEHDVDPFENENNFSIDEREENNSDLKTEIESNGNESDDSEFGSSSSNEPIYPSCNLSREEFVTLFEATVDKLCIAESNREKLYRFVQLILPLDSNIPISYYKLQKRYKTKRVEKFLVCSICKNKIITSKESGFKKVCLTETCSFNRQRLGSKYTIKIFNSDLKSQIRMILDNCYPSILDYQEKILTKKNESFIDVISGDLYSFEKNTLNLILFADGVTYNKSGANTIWTIMSSIVELPPFLRGNLENIIVHSSWSGSGLDFNTWLEKYNHDLDE
ncbi:unnamed protein product, partial [Brachionus calyciflorus]